MFPMRVRICLICQIKLGIIPPNLKFTMIMSTKTFESLSTIRWDNLFLWAITKSRYKPHIYALTFLMYLLFHLSAELQKSPPPDEKLTIALASVITIELNWSFMRFFHSMWIISRWYSCWWIIWVEQSSISLTKF